MKITDILPGVRDYLARCPTSGKGVHAFIFDAALMLHRAKVPTEEMPGLLRHATRNCGRDVPDREVDDAIASAGRILCQDATAKPRTPKWPQRNNEQIEAIVGGGVNLDALKQMSPVKWADSKPHTEEVIDVLFPGNPWLCVGWSQSSFNTRSRLVWRGLLPMCQFIVPSPMSNRVGITQRGEPSEHTLDNTGPRHFLVVECDEGTFDQHAAVLVHLAQHMKFVMAVHSGGKSLHGWFLVKGQPETKVKEFFRRAVSLGADEATWRKSQFVRLPDGWRPGKKMRQEVVYFDPEVIGKDECKQ
jgi:hypothetical protein